MKKIFLNFQKIELAPASNYYHYYYYYYYYYYHQHYYIIIAIIISFFKVGFCITFYNYKKPINVTREQKPCQAA